MADIREERPLPPPAHPTPPPQPLPLPLPLLPPPPLLPLSPCDAGEATSAPPGLAATPADGWRDGPVVWLRLSSGPHRSWPLVPTVGADKAEPAAAAATATASPTDRRSRDGPLRCVRPPKECRGARPVVRGGNGGEVAAPAIVAIPPRDVSVLGVGGEAAVAWRGRLGGSTAAPSGSSRAKGGARPPRWEGKR